MSRTQDLIKQIKHITIEIRDIKARNKIKLYSNTNTTTRRQSRTEAHNTNDHLPSSDEGDDDHSEHYNYNKPSSLPEPDSKCIQKGCAPIQCPAPTRSIAWTPPHSSHHLSLPNDGTSGETPSTKPPWSGGLNDPESPGNEGNNAVEEVCSLSVTSTNPSWSGAGDNKSVPCRKEGV